ncbi:hypothetical protein A2U01_0105680, partial [Trifolium medium]|nr:hypothetical protein [Trifolium medium]
GFILGLVIASPELESQRLFDQHPVGTLKDDTGATASEVRGAVN